MDDERSTPLTDQQRYELALEQAALVIERGGFSSDYRDMLAVMVQGRAMPGCEQAIRWAERREAARLLIVAGYSPSAIATLSGLSRGGVLSLLHRR